MDISLIVAVDQANGIGKDGRLPWRLSTDLRRFKALTLGHHLIVGRKTWESIGRLLPGRTMIVVSRHPDYPAPGARLAAGLDEALALAQAAGETEAFIGGGAQLFALALPRADRIYLTRVQAVCDCDTFLPPIEMADWTATEQVEHPAGPQDQYPFVDVVLERRYHPT